MINQFVVLVVLLGAVNQGMAACKNIPPMANYTADLVPGKFYLVAEKIAFDHQRAELRCGTSDIKSAAPENFDYVITSQLNNGTINTINLKMKNVSPPGTWNVTTADGTLTFQGTVIGAIKDKVHLYYACNTKNNKDAIWAYYYKRVNGIFQVDSESRKYALNVLRENKIQIYEFLTVNNQNCTN